MARPKYSCDFETTTDINDCRVWGHASMQIGKLSNFKHGTDIDSFMEWVEKTKGDLYFHNLRFDGEFIVNWLLQRNYKWNDSGLPNTFSTTISNMGQWYLIDICYGYTKGGKKLHTVIYDSLKKIPFPVKKIAVDFGLPILKGDIDYHKPRPIGYIPDEKEVAYMKNDVEIIARALEIQFNQGLKAMTSGSDSLKGFKDIISTKHFEQLYPVYSRELDAELRPAYKGGFTWLNDKFREQEIKHGLIFDVNSLYPSQMYDRPLPYDFPIKRNGKYEYDEKYPLHIQHLRCSFELKDGYIPMIQIKKNLKFKENQYLKNSSGEIVDLHLTNVDLELFLEHYEMYDEEYVCYWKFKQKTGVFKDFIDKWMYIKTTSTGAIKQLAKLQLNSLYGKFGSNPKVTGKIPYLKDDKSTGFKLPRDEKTDKVIDEFKDPIYIPLGIFITSWARYVTITTAQKCFDIIIYCDTDSVHITGTTIPDVIKDIIDDDKLGYWAHESVFIKGKYLRQKTYMNELSYKKVKDKNGKWKEVLAFPHETEYTKVKVKCAGMPDLIKGRIEKRKLKVNNVIVHRTFTNMPKEVRDRLAFKEFKVGFSSDGKLKPKHVRGGVVLINEKYTIK